MMPIRRIDSAPPKARTKEMEILVLGFSRTGTMSLKTALEKLGYKVYHMSVGLRNCRKGDLEFWDEALKAKLKGQGQPFGREDFDKFLSDYNVLEDIPCILFVDELLSAYPDAKVILTNRDVDSWLASFEKTFAIVLSWKTLPTLAYYDKLLWGPYMSIMGMITEYWGANNRNDRLPLRNTYIRHYSHVRHVVPADKLLEFESEDGWEPLCKFLGKDIPAETYPRVNDAAATVRLLGFVYWLRAVKLLVPPLVKVSVITSILWAAWLAFQRVDMS